MREKIQAFRKQNSDDMDGPERRPLWERCLSSWASHPPMLAIGITNLHQIVQTSDAVVFFSESLHDARIFRLGGRHPPAAVDSFSGASIGHREGDTLVVETRTFKPDQNRAGDFLVSSHTIIVERLTLTSHDELMLPAIPRLLLLVVLGCTFVYFLGAGGRKFTRSGADVSGAAFAQLSFIWSGAAATIILGLYVPIRIYNGIGSLAVLLCSLTLYEWARHTISGRSFYVAWSGNTPDALCDQGPYVYIRHPIYASYILAFLAVLVAMPTLITLAVLVCNAGLFVHAALSDKRGLTSGAFAAEYAQYKKRTGMFLPRIARHQ
jgi:protein-S-isoprenylcysteine O-methyltransferase Ste14